MSEYIEREFALNVLCRENCGHNYEANKCNNCYTSNFINYLPAADVAEVKHGKWIEYPRAHYFKCSECKETVPYKKAVLIRGKRKYKYCPNCGAKMGAEG